MRCRPNLFLIGAPKCGTTALSEYLRRHPEVCFSEPKEPYHFCADLPGYWPGLTDEEYLHRFFGHCRGDECVIGEGSVFYLFSREAVPRIVAFEPNSRFVVMVRNPVDLVRSFHSQLLYNYSEDKTDFQKAWRLQDRRRRGECIPRTCREPLLLQYRDVAALGSQLRRLYEHVPRERVKVIFFEDFSERTTEVYRGVLEFSGLSDDRRNDFPRINVAQSHRLRAIARLTQRPSGTVVRQVEWLKRRLGVERLGVLPVLRRLNTRREQRAPLPLAFRRELIDAFEDEIRLLEKSCDRSLDHWRNEELVGRGSTHRG